MGEITRVGVDLAKRVIQVHAVDATGRVIVAKQLQRDGFTAWCAQLPPGCLVAMEACSGSHHWGRRLQAMGLQVKLIAPHFVSPYRLSGKTGKNDAADAAAICEAASRPSMRFVPVKSVEQQSMVALHRLREGYKEERTACINRIRGLLAEFGLVFAQRPEVLRAALAGGHRRREQRAGRGRAHGAAACTPALDRARVPHRLVRRTHCHARAKR
jgi:transposase